MDDITVVVARVVVDTSGGGVGGCYGDDDANDSLGARNNDL